MEPQGVFVLSELRLLGPNNELRHVQYATPLQCIENNMPPTNMLANTTCQARAFTTVSYSECHSPRGQGATNEAN